MLTARSQCAHGCWRSLRDEEKCDSTQPRLAYVNSFGAARPPDRQRRPRNPYNTMRESRPSRGAPLLDLDLGADLFELLLDGRRFVLVYAFLDGLGSAIDEILGFLETQAGDFADRLDDVDLVATNIGEHDGKFR